MASGRGDLPHDLAQFVVESTLELHHGFWGLLANGASDVIHKDEVDSVRVAEAIARLDFSA